MQLINKPLRSFFSSRKSRIHSLYHTPFENQQKWFSYLISHGENTSFGKEYQIHKGMPYKAFADSVPTFNYATLLPYVERIINGEHQVLWDSRIKYLAKSSGTTESKSKFIPVSKESLRINNYRCAQDSIIFYCNLFPDNHFFSGKGLILGGCFQDMPENSPVKIGDVSAILLDKMPKIGDLLKASNREVLLHDDWNVKLPMIAETSFRQNVTSLSGVPSWMLLILKEVVKVSGKKHIKEVWPNLEVFFHGGVTFDPYIDEYRELIPDDSVFFMNMYNASEGFFGFQDQKECNDLLLLTDNGIFYEFIPMDEVGVLHDTPVPLEGVKKNQDYAMVITTPAGLWRYVVGDTVRFTSLEPYRFKITGRTMHYINAFGEELIVDNADKALHKACESTGATFTDYTAAPVFLEKENSQACHEWVIEFSTPPSDMNVFTQVLDSTLQELNSDYETKRTSELILHLPKIHIAPQGTFLRWLENRNHLGGQHKVPRLQNNRKMIEEVLALLQN